MLARNWSMNMHQSLEMTVSLSFGPTARLPLLVFRTCGHLVGVMGLVSEWFLPDVSLYLFCYSRNRLQLLLSGSCGWALIVNYKKKKGWQYVINVFLVLDFYILITALDAPASCRVFLHGFIGFPLIPCVMLGRKNCSTTGPRNTLLTVFLMFVWKVNNVSAMTVITSLRWPYSRASGCLKR